MINPDDFTAVRDDASDGDQAESVLFESCDPDQLNKIEK